MTRVWFLLMAGSLALALGFARATPFGGAPDEAAHFRYVAALAHGEGLPRLDLSRPRASAATDVSYEAHQPPLYYALAAPFYLAGEAIAGRDGARAAVRFCSMLLGLLGLALIWALARSVAPEDPALAIAATGIAALLPMRLAVVSSVSNDALAEAVATACLIAMLRPLDRAPAWRDAALLGLLLGIALLTKSSSLMLLPAALAALTCQARREGGFQAGAFVRQCAIVFGIALAMAAPWLWRNVAVYGDPLGRAAFTWYFQDTPRYETHFSFRFGFLAYLLRFVLPVTFASFWGAFGYLSPDEWFLFMGALRKAYPPPSWLYPLLALATLAALAGLGRRWLAVRHDFSQRATAVGVVLGLHAALVTAALLSFNTEFFQAQGRYLFPALATITIGLATGWMAWTPVESRTRAAWLIVGGMAALAIYALVGVVAPGFERLAGSLG